MSDIHSSVVRRVGNTPCVTLTGPGLDITLSQGQCAAVVALAEMHNQPVQPMITHTHPELEARIAALEAHMKRDTDAVAQAVADLEDDAKAQPECFAQTAAPSGAIGHINKDGSIRWITPPQTKPAQPSGDDAAVKALCEITFQNAHGPWCLYPHNAGLVLAAIRAGKVPGVIWSDDYLNMRQIAVYNEVIAALRAKLAEAERFSEQRLKTANEAYNAKWDEIAADRDRLAAQVAELTRERDSWKTQAEANHRESGMREQGWIDAEAERDKALADLAAERSKYDALHVGMSDVLGVEGYTDAGGLIAGGRAVVASLSAMTERAENAEPESDHNFQAGAAARAEAESAKAELHVTKLSVAEWHADAERLAKDLGEAVRLLRTAGDDFLTLQETAWHDDSDIQGYHYSEISEEIEAFLARITQEKKS